VEQYVRRDRNLGNSIISTDRDGVFEGALGVHDIPLDDRIRRLELAKLGVVGLAEQVFRDCGQGLLRSE
jgi:hypothetical protein